MQIKRRINGKTSKHPVYTKDEADNKKLDYVYWRQAEIGDWAITDDNFVSECYARKDYTDKNGKEWVNRDMKWKCIKGIKG